MDQLECDKVIEEEKMPSRDEFEVEENIASNAQNELLKFDNDIDQKNMTFDDENCLALNEDLSNCLMLAAKENKATKLEEILARQLLNVNATDMFGWTALMYACYYGHSECARHLLLAGALADTYDNDQMSCLIWASGRGHLKCVEFLIQLGKAKVNMVDKYGTSALIWASRKGFTEIASELLKAGSNVDSIGVSGWSALLVSVMNDHLETMKLLLQHKPNVNTCDVHQYTPLIVASKEGRLEMVKLLVKARAFVNLTDEYGNTALIHAAKGCHLDVVDFLLKQHANIDHCGGDNKTALFWAVEKGNLTCVERLLQAKPNLDIQTKDGETCLIRAIKLRKFAIVRVLLAHHARVSIPDKNGDNVLHIACRMQSATLAHLILSNPKNLQLLHKQNKAKKTPLMLDAENSNPVLNELIEVNQQNSGKKVTYRLSDKSFKLHAGSSLNLETNNNNNQFQLLSKSSLSLTSASGLFHQNKYSSGEQYLSHSVGLTSIDEPQAGPSSSTEYPQQQQEIQTKSNSLIKKLTSALHLTHSTPQTQMRVLA